MNAAAKKALDLSLEVTHDADGAPFVYVHLSSEFSYNIQPKDLSDNLPYLQPFNTIYEEGEPSVLMGFRVEEAHGQYEVNVVQVQKYDGTLHFCSRTLLFVDATLVDASYNEFSW
jgi:hypothetical protein